MTLSVYCKFCNWNKPSFIDLFLQTFFTGFCITRKPIKCRKCKQIFYIKKCEKNVALGVCSCIVVTLIPEFSNFLHFLKISGEPGLPDIKAKNLQERPRQKQSPNVMSTNY